MSNVLYSWFKKQIKKITHCSTSLMQCSPQWILGCILCVSITSFMAGYFWGQRKAVEYFIKRIEEDSFADRISYALYTMNDKDRGILEEIETTENENSDTNQSNENEDDSNGSDQTNDSSENISENNENSEESDSSDVEVEIDVPVTTSADLKLVSVEEPVLNQTRIEEGIEHKKPTECKVYLARLAGFGTLKVAQGFLERVKRIDEKAHIIERVHKKGKGKKVTWYQVETGEYADKEMLEKRVKQIKHKEHLGDIHIIEQLKSIN